MNKRFEVWFEIEPAKDELGVYTFDDLDAARKHANRFITIESERRRKWREKIGYEPDEPYKLIPLDLPANTPFDMTGNPDYIIIRDIQLEPRPETITARLKDLEAVVADLKRIDIAMPWKCDGIGRYFEILSPEQRAFLDGIRYDIDWMASSC